MTLPVPRIDPMDPAAWAARKQWRDENREAEALDQWARSAQLEENSVGLFSVHAWQKALGGALAQWPHALEQHLDSGHSLLGRAIDSMHSAYAEALVRAGAPLEEPNHAGTPPRAPFVHAAATRGWVGVLTALLERGAPAEAIGGWERLSALQSALIMEGPSQCDRLAVVQTLLAHGADPHRPLPAARGAPDLHAWLVRRRPDEPVTRWWQSCRLAESLAQHMEPPAPGLKRPRL